MPGLYGPEYIEQQRSAGYKSTVYAMAEIIDNSVDAQANIIDLIFVEKETKLGKKSSIGLDEIYFLDNGSGMSYDRINSCLTFSAGEGRNDKRIGSFGVGLPNSSISVGRRVEVYSKDESDQWNYVFLDLDDQAKRSDAEFDESIQKNPDFDTLIEINKNIRTIIKWSKLDKLDNSGAKTIIGHVGKLLGRIYRYKIQTGLKISCCSYLKGNSEYTIEPENIIPNDPLYVMKERNYMTDLIWKWGREEDPAGKHKTLQKNPIFRSMYYYSQFLEGCEENETILPLFQKHDDYWKVPYTIEIGKKKYSWEIRASFANSGITKPGIRSGGGTKIGAEFGKKMSGDRKNFKSANIFFMRANREVDFGSYGMYTVTDEKNRFWTIEIHFNSDLDELMGVSNTKQSVAFKSVVDSDFDFIENHKDTPLGVQRDILWNQMTGVITRCIKAMKKELKGYSDAFIELERHHITEKEEDETPVPQPEPAVIEVLPKGAPWTDQDKIEVGIFLKDKYMHLDKETIDLQVENFARGLTKTIVLYSPNETGDLFELVERRGKHITLINTKHDYYIKIIQPLKDTKHLKIFAISIEILISSLAFEMNRLNEVDSEKHESTMNEFLLQLSSRLNIFIQDAHIKIVPEELSNLRDKEVDKEEDE